MSYDTGENTTVIYHKNCLDGFASACAAKLRYPDADFIAASYGDKPVAADTIKGKTVYFVDFSYKREPLISMSDSAERVVVIDHHKTALEELVDLPDNVEVHFDMYHSGCVLSWKYFLPDIPVPMLFELVEDRDLWWFNLSRTREINAALFARPMEFNAWFEMMGIGLTPPPGGTCSIVIDHGVEARMREELFTEGSVLLRYRDKLIRQFVERAYETELFGRTVLEVNVPPAFASDVCGELAEGRPFACGWSVIKNGDGELLRINSLRARPELKSGGKNPAYQPVDELARSMGGGGHPNAAGFESAVAMWDGT